MDLDAALLETFHGTIVAPKPEWIREIHGSERRQRERTFQEKKVEALGYADAPHLSAIGRIKKKILPPPDEPGRGLVLWVEVRQWDEGTEVYILHVPASQTCYLRAVALTVGMRIEFRGHQRIYRWKDETGERRTAAEVRIETLWPFRDSTDLPGTI